MDVVVDVVVVLQVSQSTGQLARTKMPVLWVVQSSSTKMAQSAMSCSPLHWGVVDVAVADVADVLVAVAVVVESVTVVLVPEVVVAVAVVEVAVVVVKVEENSHTPQMSLQLLRNAALILHKFGTFAGSGS